MVRMSGGIARHALPMSAALGFSTVLGFSIALGFVVGLPVTIRAQETTTLMPLQFATKLPDQKFQRDAPARLALPALPARKGMIPVLRGRFFIQAPASAGVSGGFNYNAGISLNGTPLQRTMSTNRERLLQRKPSLKLLSNGQHYAVFNSDLFAVMFAPNADLADSMTADKQGATYTFDLSDVARGVDGNALEIRGVLAAAAADNNVGTNSEDGMGRAVDLAVGYLPQKVREVPPTPLPQRGKIALTLQRGNLKLEAGKQGGFALGFGGSRLLVETDLGVTEQLREELIADDKAPGPRRTDRPIVTLKRVPGGIDMSAQWPTALTLQRQLRFTDGDRLSWRDTWKNDGSREMAIPFNHRFFIAGQPDAKPLIGGNPESEFMASNPSNPTIFIGSAAAPGRPANGFGWVAEDDWLRALLQMRRDDGTAQAQTRNLALAPGKSIAFEMSLQAQKSDSYWTFINALRRRWHVDGVRIDRAIVWGTPPQGLAGRGNVAQVIGPWLGLQFDTGAALALNAKYGNKPVPDEELRQFYRFEHRANVWQGLRNNVAKMRREAPAIQVWSMMHPAMEVAYVPKLALYPFHGEEIIGPSGKPFSDAGYSRSWLGSAPQNGWEVLYIAPTANSKYSAELRARIRQALDEAKVDGIYSDEFTFATTTRIYSRYDYRKWDGYSVLLDETGNIKTKVTDNVIATRANQLGMIAEVKKRHKHMLVNTAPATRAVQTAGIYHFGEGGNGHWFSASMHLTTPLVLGNVGQPKTTADLLAISRKLLETGALHVPHGDVGAMLEGPHNFIAEQFPMTPQELGPGYVRGPERIVTAVDRTFALPANIKSYRLWRYDKNGRLIEAAPALKTLAAKQRTLALTVSPQGLTIAELIAAPAQ